MQTPRTHGTMFFKYSYKWWILLSAFYRILISIFPAISVFEVLYIGKFYNNFIPLKMNSTFVWICFSQTAFNYTDWIQFYVFSEGNRLMLHLGIYYLKQFLNHKVSKKNNFRAVNRYIDWPVIDILSISFCVTRCLLFIGIRKKNKLYIKRIFRKRKWVYI